MCLWLALHAQRQQRVEAGGPGIGPIPTLTLLLSSPLPGIFCQFCAASCGGVEGCWLCCARIFLAWLQSWLLVFPLLLSEAPSQPDCEPGFSALLFLPFFYRNVYQQNLSLQLQSLGGLK